MKIFNKIINLFTKNPKPIDKLIEKEITEEKPAEKKPEKEVKSQPKVIQKSESCRATLLVNIKKIPFDLCVRNLDDSIDIIKVQGSGREPYLVKLSELSCTCGDFIEMRSALPANDIRRVCKHQGGVIASSRQSYNVETDKIFGVMLRNLGGKSFQRYSSAIEVSFNEPIDGPEVFYLFKEEGRDWVDVLILNGDSLGKYGFNIKKKQWARKQNPFPQSCKGKYTKAMKIAFGKMEAIDQSMSRTISGKP